VSHQSDRKGPVPAYGISIDVHAELTDDGGKAEVDAIAEQLGMHVRDDTAKGGHYYTGRDFSSVRYCFVAVSSDSYRRLLAETSDAGCVTPDTWTR
jgi:hypothetical protein